MRHQFILNCNICSDNQDWTRKAQMDTDLDMSNRISQATHISLKHKDITDKILYAFFKIVYPQLGHGTQSSLPHH
jgi:hypothetical protein